MKVQCGPEVLTVEELIEALKAQTVAIHRLAESNEALVSLLMRDEDEDEDEEGFLSARKPA